ncbi:MAG: heme exporter protein C [Kiritimatiellia bacterium]|jgi:heme exporter protein C
MRFHWEHIVGIIGLAILVYGQYYGLVLAPPDRHMGDVARILFVHVPVAINSFAVLGISFVAALGFIVTTKKGFDHVLGASLEVGVLYTAVLIMQGSIFARPTWGVWWTWDPRLTASAVMLITYVSVLILRALIFEPGVRGMVTSVVTILASVTLPITYFSVQLWRSMHQLQSSSMDLGSGFKFGWRVNLTAFFLVAIWLIVRRYRIAKIAADNQAPPPLPEAI